MGEIFKLCRPFFLYTGIFSFVTNLLLLTQPLFMLQVFDRVLHSRSNETLIMLSALALFTLAVAAILDSLRSRLLNQFGDTLERKLREPVFKAMVETTTRNGSTNHGLSDLSTLQKFLTGNGIKALFDLPWVPIFLFVLYLFHPMLCAIAASGALILFCLAILEEKISSKTQLTANAELRKSNDFINTALRNSETVVAMGMHDHLYRRWRRLNERYLRTSTEVTKKSAKIVASSGYMRSSLSIITMTAAAGLIINVDGMTPGIMIASTIILGRTLSPMLAVIRSWKSFLNAREAYARLDTLLKGEKEKKQTLSLPSPKGALAVENLLFFVSREKIILHSVSFGLRAGESLGIIGESASGKTSLARLLAGVYRPSDGKVRLDGADLFYWSRNGLADYIGYLPQNVQLFDGTVAENIARMQDPHKNARKVVNAAKQARIHDMILRLPKGYDTDIGNGGVVLSGGQRQLIGLARALYGEPKLLVLDEPNSNLDGPSELNLISLIADLKDQRVTLVIISHKPSLMRGLDKLLVLKNGRQQAFGARDEVMQYLSAMNKSTSTPARSNVKALNQQAK